MSGRLAFVCAMPMEMAPLRRPLSLRTGDARPPQLFEGVLDGRPVAAVTTGMGPALARRGVERLFAAVEVDRVVVVGITGAVDDETPIGTLVSPETVIDGSTGTAYRPHPLGGGDHAGTMWTTDELITDPDRIASLRATGVTALDMETAAVGAACDARGIPWSVVRVISDRANDGSIDHEVFAMSNQDGTPNPRSVLSYVVRHPNRLPGMARMGRQARAATHRAADLAVRAVRDQWQGDGS
jgi:adenosylhomocysteine nucleosidase